ncbi:MAG TPA: hypothetical protein VF042_13775, partial [Gemmatimonadaceae bacterium]
AAVASIVGLTAARQNAKPARYLYVWAGTGTHHERGKNMIVVIDVDPKSPKYTQVLNVLTVDTAGGMPHHSELALPSSGPLFVNDYGMDRSYLIDFKDPVHPKLAGRTAAVPGGSMMHSFARLPNGNTLATIQFGDSGTKGKPGKIAEFDNKGQLVRYSSSADSTSSNPAIRTYALSTVPALDRVVTTSSPMDSERPANVVQVWSIPDLKLLATLQVPTAADSAYMFPFELETLGDGRSVMMNTYYCGFYWITGLDSKPKMERVMAMDHPKNIGCSVPMRAGNFVVMPIAYAHRYATIDITDPAHPKEISSFETDSTFFPHWISGDPGSDRVVVTDQGDGEPMVRIAHFDRMTGKMRWDDKFKLSFANVSWPNGVKGKVTPHGAVFVP